MNEIDVLRDLRSDLPGPRAESRATARGLLVAQIERAARQPARRPARRSSKPKLLLAGGALAIALLVALSSLIFGGSGQVQPAVGQVLRRVADVAAAQPPEPPPGPGQYFYTRSREAFLTTIGRRSVLTPRIRQTWIADNGAGRARVVDRSGEVEDSALTGQPFLDTTGLPTQPRVLRKLIEARKVPLVDGPPGEAETFTLVGDMLRDTYLPPAFRATLYRVVAELPTVELQGEVKDPVGRTGIGVAFTDGSTTHELIFDPDTSVLLGEREVAATRIPALAVPAGTEIGSTAYLEQKVVDSVGRGAPPGAGHLRQSVGCYERPSMQAACSGSAWDGPDSRMPTGLARGGNR
ncbi:MAG TPA: CU044_5270 family protein [Solirubrobacterales bacterium]|nr:CU044_5270 family protein [Solirubrobacterales bacterium]